LKIETTSRDDHQVQLVTELDEEVLEKFIHRAARHLAQKVKIPGFRPGKAPFDMIKRHIGEEALEQEAIELLVDEYYPQVLKEANVNPSGPGQLEKIIAIHPPKFSFIVPLVPEIDLGDYTLVRKDYEPKPIGDQDIEEVIHSLQRSFATAEPVERSAAEGDVVYAMVSAVLTDPAEGENADLIQETPYQAVIGDKTEGQDNWPYSGFSLELVGTSADEEKTVEYTYTEDSPFDKLRGKSARFTVKLQSVKSLKLPELDDEFAKTVGDYENLDALRVSIRERLEQTRQEEYDQEYISEIIDEMVKKATIKYPPHMVDDEVEHSLNHLREDLARQKLDLETYLKLRKLEINDFIENEVKPAARQRLERSLLMEKIAEVEKIELTRDELQSAVRDTMSELQNTPDFGKIKARKQMENLANTVTYQTANRLLNERINEHIKLIATGNVKAVEEKVEQVETPAEGSEQEKAPDGSEEA
jgi:trigger factor